MNGNGSKLSSLDHQRILREVILPDSELELKTSFEHPRAIILAGQPGAGKGDLVRSAKNALEQDVVVVDPDELRSYHPDAKRFQTKHPYTWPTNTHPDASQWAGELRQAAIDQKKNLIIDTTLGHGDSAVR